MDDDRLGGLSLLGLAWDNKAVFVSTWNVLEIVGRVKSIFVFIVRLRWECLKPSNLEFLARSPFMSLECFILKG